MGQLDIKGPQSHLLFLPASRNWKHSHINKHGEIFSVPGQRYVIRALRQQMIPLPRILIPTRLRHRAILPHPNPVFRVIPPFPHLLIPLPAANSSHGDSGLLHRSTMAADWLAREESLAVAYSRSAGDMVDRFAD